MIAQPPPQLSFALNNQGAPGTVYISSLASDNNLTLVITSNVAASLTPGTVVPIGGAGQGSGSLFYLDLSQLGLSEPEFNALKIDPKQWAFQCYYSQSSQVIGFTPKGPMNLSAAGSISLGVEQFTMTKVPAKATVQLDVIYFRVGSVTTGNIPLAGNFLVTVTYPPDQHKADLHTAIMATLDPTEVVNSPEGGPYLQNSLNLFFSQVPPIEVPAAEDTDFTLTFIYADDKDGFGAMMTRAEAQPPFAVAQGQYASGWGITPHTGDQQPYWTLKPPKGQPIVGTGTQSSVSFQITGLATTFQPGPTVVSVSYRHVPGYKDGSFTLPVEKVPHVQISSFHVVPEQSTPINGKAAVTLSWTTSNATVLTLLPIGQDVTGSSSFPTEIAATTQFSLVAEGQRPGNVDNRAIAHCTATVTAAKPNIKTFTAVWQGVSLKISWEVEDTDFVVITNIPANMQPASGSYDFKPSVQQPLPESLTLTAKNSGGSVTSELVLGIQQIARSQNFGGSEPRVIAVSPDGSRLFGADRFVGLVVLDTATMKPVAGSPVNLGGTLTSVAVSSRGQVFVTHDHESDEGSGTLFILDANTLQQTAGSPIQLGSHPLSVAVSADANSVFVADDADQNVTKFAYTNGTFARVNGIGVGQALAVAVSADGQRVFVTRYDKTMVALDAHTLAIQGSPVKVGDLPMSLAVSPDSQRVFVASYTYANMPVFHADTLAPVQGSPVGVGANPQSVAVSQDGEFVFVTVGEGASLAVVHADTLVPIPGSPFDMGMSPASVAVSPNIARFFLACSNASVGWFEAYSLAYSPAK